MHCLSAGQSQTTVSLTDAAGQLLEIRSDSQTGTLLEAFVYDGNGQLTKHCAQGPVTRTVNDCSGTDITELTYNADRRLIHIQKTGQPAETYRYDPQGRRIQIVIGTGPTQQTIRYQYDGDTIYAEYHNGYDQPAYRTVHAGLDRPIGRYSDSSAQYYLQGGLNNILGLTNDQGQLTASQCFDAWGNTVEHTGTVPQYGYQAREPNTAGLIYYRARYYQPHTGRFTQPDPKGFIDGINRYAYAVNSPVNYADPYGTSVIPREYNTLASQQQSYYSTPASTSTSGLNPSSGSVFTGESYQVAANLGPGCPAGLGVCSVQGGGGGGSIAGAGSIGRVAGGGSVAKGTVGGLRAAGKKDAHHIIQDAAVRDLPGYKTNAAPGVQLPGPSNVANTPHNLATKVQRQSGGGTYAAERRIGYKALRRAGISEPEARALIQQSDEYFGSIGVGPNTVTRIPGNR